MHIKYIEGLKNIDDNDIEYLINSSFNYYVSNETISDDIKQNDNKKKNFSSLVRFYRSFNSNKKHEEEHLAQSLKELFKNKTAIISSLMDKINKINQHQTKRIKFGESTIDHKHTLVSHPSTYVGGLASNIKRFQSLTWRVNITISNNASNRVYTFY
jgi:hypothetical protein